MKNVPPLAFHRNTTLSLVLSAASLGLSAYQFLQHPSSDFRLYGSVASLFAFGAAMSEFEKYASRYQFLGIFASMISLGLSLDHRLPVIPFFSIAMVLSFVTWSHYFARRWVSETDFMYVNLVLVAASLGIYLYANLHFGYGWKGWALAPAPLVVIGGFRVGDLMHGKAAVNYVKGRKQNVEVGKPAPSFSLNDIKGEVVCLDDFRSKRHVLIVFIRGDWCPSCRIKLRTYEKHREKFLQKNIQLLTISPSDAEANRDMVMNIGIDFNVLCDANLEVAKKYGVQLPTEVAGEKYSAGLPLPASFLVDKNGMVRYTSRPDRVGEFLDPTTIFPALEQLS